MSLYEQVLAELHPYLGDRSGQFLERQIRGHINIEPEQLSKNHIPELARWIRISASLIVSKEDAEIIRKKIETFSAVK